MNIGTVSLGLKCPIIKEGDDICQIVKDVILSYDTCLDPQNDDVICITESIVARAQGNYVTVDDIAQFLKDNGYPNHIVLYAPIMSRNRFSLILKGFARYCEHINIILEGDYDEQGNPNYGVNMFTGVNMQQYYKEICEKEDCTLIFISSKYFKSDRTDNFIDARCHPNRNQFLHTLRDILNRPVIRPDGTKSGYNEEWGLLGSNMATEDTLKLFPRDCNQLCLNIQNEFYKTFGISVEVLIYGDGCFKDPVGKIWEFADPVTCPGYTPGLKGTPNELKLKYFADNKFKELSGEELEKAIKQEIKKKDSNLVGQMVSQGTTPRRYIDLLASLADLTSGSGDKGTPIVYIQNYFNNYND